MIKKFTEYITEKIKLDYGYHNDKVDDYLNDVLSEDVIKYINNNDFSIEDIDNLHGYVKYFTKKTTENDIYEYLIDFLEGYDIKYKITYILYNKEFEQSEDYTIITKTPIQIEISKNPMFNGIIIPTRYEYLVNDVISMLVVNDMLYVYNGATITSSSTQFCDEIFYDIKYKLGKHLKYLVGNDRYHCFSLNLNFNI